VVDGDTIDITIGGHDDTVRLIGIDTPETVKPDAPVECFGAEASAHLAALLPAGTPVRLERDEVARDRFGRLLAYVYLDQTFVNLELVEQGYAEARTYGDNESLAGPFAAAEATARDAGRGLWGACGGPHVPVDG
jgi:micrococcal nuclease